MGDAKVLNGSTAAMVVNGCLTIFESQQEYEGEQGAVTPAKSIWLNKRFANHLA